MAAAAHARQVALPRKKPTSKDIVSWAVEDRATALELLELARETWPRHAVAKKIGAFLARLESR